MKQSIVLHVVCSFTLVQLVAYINAQVLQKTIMEQYANRNQFNYVAVLRDLSPPDWKVFCGATIIHKFYAVTVSIPSIIYFLYCFFILLFIIAQAAQCVVNRHPKTTQIQVTHDLRFDNETQFESVTMKFWIHPNYKTSRLAENDIAFFKIGLVRFKDPAEKGEFIEFDFVWVF